MAVAVGRNQGIQPSPQIYEVLAFFRGERDQISIDSLRRSGHVKGARSRSPSSCVNCIAFWGRSSARPSVRRRQEELCLSHTGGI